MKLKTFEVIKSTSKKTFSVLLAGALMISALSGCGSKNESAETGSEVKLAGDSSVYPMECADTLKVWMPLNDSIAMKYSNLADTPFGKAWMEKTGVKLEFVHPTAGNAQEQFSLITASKKDTPDIILYDWYSVAGGPQKYIKEKAIYDLKEPIEKWAPNLKKYLSENPEIDKAVKTDEGAYYVFPFIRSDDLLTVSKGPMIRKDLLDKNGIAVPETIDEWHNALTVLKQNGVKIPLSYQLLKYETDGMFSGAFGAPLSFFVDDEGKVQYGPVQPGAKDYLETMNTWYNEGLLDQNISSIETTQLDSNVLNGSVAATVGYAGSAIGSYMKTMSKTDPNFNIVAAPNPSLVKGEKSGFGQKDHNYVPTNSAAISTNCKNVELAVRLLDFAYSEEGALLFNFGVEGESYTMENNEPIFTDYVLNNPDGLSVSQALAPYMMMGSGPYVQDVRYIKQYYQLPQQSEALEVWGNTDAKAHKIPQITYSDEESRKAAKIQNEVTNYVQEMWLKFIMGVEPISKFDEYVKTIEEMGLSELIGYNEAAIKRYEQR